MLRKYQEWEEREINRIIDERMADPAPGVPIEDIMRETLARSECVPRRLPPAAQTELRKIPRDMALRILAKLTELESDPLAFNTIQHGDDEGVGPIRSRPLLTCMLDDHLACSSRSITR